MAYQSRENVSITRLQHELDLFTLAGISAIYPDNPKAQREVMDKMQKLRRLISNLEHPYRFPDLSKHPGWNNGRDREDVRPVRFGRSQSYVEVDDIVTPANVRKKYPEYSDAEWAKMVEDYYNK